MRAGAGRTERAHPELLQISQGTLGRVGDTHDLVEASKVERMIDNGRCGFECIPWFHFDSVSA